MTQRWLALDRLRALAVLLMVQGHTFTALMRPGAMGEGPGRLHSLIHGLTAPMFLLGAGLAFGVTTYPQYETHRTDRDAFRKRMMRYATLLLIGYALQVPGASIQLVLSRHGDQLAPFFRVGPLHLIGVTLGIAQVSVRFIRSPRAHVAWMVALTGVVLAVTPAMYQSSLPSDVGIALGSWLDRRHGSFFPLFPWASFAMLGVIAGGVISMRGALLPARAIAAFGLSAAGLSYLLYELRLIPVDDTFWNTSPFYVAFRVGLVAIILGLLHRPSDADKTVQKQFSRSVTATLARHSLVAYVVHLLVLYGTPLTPNFSYRLQKSLSLGQVTLAAALVLGATLAITLAWNWLSRERTTTFRWVRMGLAIGCALVLVR